LNISTLVVRLKSIDTLEQLLISLSNFLLVYGSSFSLSLADQDFVLTVYTVTIAFFPLFFSLIVQPFLQASYKHKPSIIYLLCLLILTGFLIFVYILFSYIYRLSEYSFLQLATLAFFVLSFYYYELTRRFLFSLGFIKFAFVGAIFIAITRSSVFFFSDAQSFLVVNLLLNFAFFLFFLVCILWSTSSILFSFSFLFDSSALLLSSHVSSWRIFLPISLLGFVTSSFPMLFASRMLAVDFVLFSKIRALFSLFNPALEYFDGYLSSSSHADPRQLRNAYILSARLITFAGVVFSFLLSFLFVDSTFAYSFLLIPRSQFSIASYDFLPFLVFLIGISSTIMYCVRVYAAFFRRISRLSVELYSLSFSAIGLFMLFSPPSLYSALALFLLISLLQLCAYLYSFSRLRSL